MTQSTGLQRFVVVDKPLSRENSNSFSFHSNTESDEIEDFHAPDPNLDIAQRPWLPKQQTPYIIYNAKLIDPRRSKLRTCMTLCLAEGKVLSVTPTTPRDCMAEFYHGGAKAVKIDASDYFVCPGLIDCHVHLMAVHGSGTLKGAFEFPHEVAVFRSAGLLRGILSNGFTSCRDVGGATIAHAQATEEWIVPGPRVFQGGRMLSQTGGHGDDTDPWVEDHCCSASGIGASALGRLCDGVPECLKAARDNIRKGANHLKVCTSGGIASQTDSLESIQFTVEELQAITTVAKNMGVTRVTAHCYTPAGIRHAIEGGITGIEHGSLIDAPTARLMAEHNVVLTPTLGLHKYLTMPPYNKFQNEKSMRKNAEIGGAAMKAIQYAEDAGVCVCYGTDTVGPVLPMQTFEFAVRAVVLPSATVLKHATINGAKNLGMEGLLGELIPGAYADVLFLEENPLEDVTSFYRKEENLLAIIKDGRVVKSRVPGLAVERACDWN